MQEALAIIIGLACGGVAAVVPPRARRPLFSVLTVLGGVLASAMNGELTSQLWAAFVSFDVLLVWAGASVSVATMWSWRRLHIA